MAAKHDICAVEELPPGERKIVKLGARSVGVFNVGGDYFALLNVCPHMGAELCEGPLCGTNAETDDYRFEHVRDGEVLRCARHGWEFDVRNGENLIDPSLRAKTYLVAVEDGRVIVTA